MCVSKFQFAIWEIPFQLSKCCRCMDNNKDREDYNYYPIPHFKPYGDNEAAKLKIINDYLKLSKGTFITNRNSGCCNIMIAMYRKYICVTFWLILLLPFHILAVSLSFIGWFLYAFYLMLRGFILFHCCCNCLCCRQHRYRPANVNKIDGYSYFTLKESEIELRRFQIYKFPIYLYCLLKQIYLRLCQYLSGLFTARLISDEMIIYWTHLATTTNSKFVYAYDPKTNKPIRIKGIIDDYSYWSSNESVSDFWENTTFEILSVYIDYDDNNRIIFTLRNGEIIKEPRFHGENANDWDGNINNLSNQQLNEIRVWNIIKAHYQSQLSIYPALIHTWTHYHFSDLISRYIEQKWNDNGRNMDETNLDFMVNSATNSMDHSVLNRIIRSHTYYTSFFNAKGTSESYTSPQLKQWNLCEFIFAPWKILPASSDIIIPKLFNVVTDFYFKDMDDNISDFNDEEYKQVENPIWGQSNSETAVSVELRVNVNDENPSKFTIQNGAESSVIKRQESELKRTYLSKHSHIHNFDLKFKPNIMNTKLNSVSTTTTTSAPYSPSINDNNDKTPHNLMKQHSKFETQEIDLDDYGSYLNEPPTKRSSLLLNRNFTLNSEFNGDKVDANKKAHKVTDTMIVIPEPMEEPKFRDVASNVPKIPNGIPSEILYKNEVSFCVQFLCFSDNVSQIST